ncbi:MAG TPA: hypothetical protein ENN99_02240, partial [Chloroflexi bacterium]|nr:hypothetical protein [Chloroflexota bacterium]
MATKGHIGKLLLEGESNVRAGQRAAARQMFRAVLSSDPTNLPALLWMAWLSDDPRASLAYVSRALECDPHNPRAHAALRWARRRATPLEPSEPLAAAQSLHRRPAVWIVSALLVVILLVGSALLLLPKNAPAWAALARIQSPTATVTHALTPTPLPTATPSP